MQLVNIISTFILENFMVKPVQFIINLISKFFLPLMVLMFIGLMVVNIANIILIIKCIIGLTYSDNYDIIE